MLFYLIYTIYNLYYIYIQYSKTAYAKWRTMSLLYQAIQTFNSLPKGIKLANSILTIKTQVKQFFLL